MPFVHIRITDEGVTREQKAELVRRATDSLVDVLGKNPATTHVVVEEVPLENWGIGGELVAERRARSAAAQGSSRLGAQLDRVLGREARDRREEARRLAAEGARAALETFYYAFNQRDLGVLEEVWAPDETVVLSNPVGGVLRGIGPIRSLYERIFTGPARVWVEYHDVVEYLDGRHALFVGRERGEAEAGGRRVELAIRTTRVFRHLGAAGWRQVHHHGSIDDASLLARYQELIRGAAT